MIDAAATPETACYCRKQEVMAEAVRLTRNPDELVFWAGEPRPKPETGTIKEFLAIEPLGNRTWYGAEHWYALERKREWVEICEGTLIDRMAVKLAWAIGHKIKCELTAAEIIVVRRGKVIGFESRMEITPC